MKRHSHLYEQLCTLENIYIADSNARKGKSSKKCILMHDLHRVDENAKLLDDFKNLSYKTSEYRLGKVYEPKERIIYKLPYFPDRIAHHSIMNIVKPIWIKTFIHNTYSCIEGRGIHSCAHDLKWDLKKNPDATKYCLKLDIRKFYPSIDHDELKKCIRKKIKDDKFLVILDEIIDSTDTVDDDSTKIGVGVPIGNYLSQFFANLFLSELDHLCKEELKCKYYYRYADDIVILSDDKKFLRTALIYIKLYLKCINLKVKDNYQIFPVDKRGIDFVGYVFYHDHTLLRKSIKVRINKLVDKYIKHKISEKTFKVSMSAYYGWLKYADSKHFLKKIEEKTGIKYSTFIGEKIGMTEIYDKTIKVVEILPKGKTHEVHFIMNGKPYIVTTLDSIFIKDVLKHKRQFPVKYTVNKYNFRLYLRNKSKKLKAKQDAARASKSTTELCNSITADR